MPRARRVLTGAKCLDTVPHALAIPQAETPGAPMAKLFAIYQQPKDPAAFDSHYFGTHVPLAKKIPGLKGYEVTRGDVMGMGGKHGVYMVAILEFESMAAIGAAMASPEGQATAADLANFAGAGVDVMMGETRLV